MENHIPAAGLLSSLKSESSSSDQEQGEIAAEAGFASANMIAMIKGSSSRLPLDRVPALAKALETDLARLFLMGLEQQDNALPIVMKEIFGTPVTKNEIDWLEELRIASDHSDPNLTTKARKALRGLFGNDHGTERRDETSPRRASVGPPLHGQ